MRAAAHRASSSTGRSRGSRRSRTAGGRGRRRHGRRRGVCSSRCIARSTGTRARARDGFLRESWLAGASSSRHAAPRGSSRSAARRADRPGRAGVDGERDACRRSSSSCSRRASSRDAERARLSRQAPRRAHRGRLRGVALVPHGDVQGALRGDQLGASIPTSPTRRSPSRSAMFHQRFSTNTEPDLGARAAVPAALPQRRDQHDRRERRLDARPASALGRSIDELCARCSTESGSDSAMLDNALELLVSGGPRRRDTRSRMLVPPAWQSDPRVDAGACATSTATTRCSSSLGRSRRRSSSPTGACRRRARPQRPAAAAGTPFARTAWSSARSEAGAVAAARRRGGCGGGGSARARSSAVDPARGLLVRRRDEARASRRAGPYGALGRRRRSSHGSAAAARRPRATTCARQARLRLHARGAARVLRPIAPTGARARPTRWATTRALAAARRPRAARSRRTSSSASPR